MIVYDTFQIRCTNPAPDLIAGGIMTVNIPTLKIITVLLSIVSVAATVAATGQVDAGFVPVPAKALSSQNTTGVLAQSDGKIVIWGANFSVDAQAGGQITRLNVDGSADASFNYCGCLLSSVTNVGIQPDGKLIVAGTSLSYQSKVVRLNLDGSNDTSFNSVFNVGGFASSSAEFFALQPDGKILVSTAGGYGNGFHAGYLTRLNSDGNADAAFTPAGYDGGRTIYGYLRSVAVDVSGKIYWAVTTYSAFSSSASVRRLNVDGTSDSTFEAPSITGSGLGTGLDAGSIFLQADGALIVGGRFDAVNGVFRKDLVRVLPAGNVDLTFNPPVLPGSVNQVAIVSGGKILITTGGKLMRLASDGTLDGTFVHPVDVSSVYRKWTVDTLDRIIFFGASSAAIDRFFRVNSAGNVDASFNPNVGIFGTASAMVRQPSGQFVVAGSFASMNGTARPSFARINADGTTDPTFDPGTGFDVVPSTLAVQSDGKILAAGTFTTYNGTGRFGLIRLNANGTLDTAFAPVVGSVYSILVQSDSKILITGGFTTVNSVARERVARLNADGSLDTTFTPIISSGAVYSAAQTADGKYIVGGAFSGVDGFNRSNLVRLNSNGSIDQTFNAGSISSIDKVYSVAGDKVICLAGAGGASAILRRNGDGTADATFTPAVFVNGNSSDLRLNAISIQTDGSILVGGNFTSVGGVSRNNLTRLSSNGTLDQLFMQNGANGAVRAMATQPDGSVVVGGDFSRIENTTRAGIARVIPGLFTRVTPFDFDGDGKADVSVFRPSENKWYVLRSSDFSLVQQIFAIAGDIPVPADYDGDGKTDMAIFRPSSGDWWSLSTLDGGQKFAHWGAAGDIPRPSDYTGDGRADYIVFRPSTNQWLRMSSANGQSSDKYFGLAGDKPVTGDFDGDGKSDVAIYRPSDGNWWWQSSIDNIQRATRWGIDTDLPAPGDYDGDGKTDFAVFRPSTGVWYIINSSNGSFLIGPFGTPGDKPVAGDYDGDGKADIAIFRPSTGIWHLLRSSSGYTGYQFGVSSDIPVENAFVP